jgi:hypothetical protein
MYFYIMFGILMTCAAIIAIIFTINIALDIIFGTSIEYWLRYTREKKRAGD